MIDIVYIDDNRSSLFLLQELIETEPDLRILLSCESIEDFFIAQPSSPPDVILLDLSVVASDPEQCVRELRAMFPSTRIIIYSGYADPVLAGRLLAAGAASFILKTVQFDILFSAIRGGWTGQCLSV